MDDLRIQSTADAVRMTPVKPSTDMKLKQDEVGKQNIPHPEQAKPEPEPEDKKKISANELVNLANNYVDNFNTKISFTYNPQDEQAKILVTEKESGKVIREIPPKQMVDLMEKMQEIAGIIFNGRA